MRRRVVYPGTLIIVVLALSSLFLINPRPKTDAQSAANCCGTNPPTAPREIVFPYYSLAGGFNSTLLLVSDSGDPLSFVIAVHSLSGQTQLSNSMTISPAPSCPLTCAACSPAWAPMLREHFRRGVCQYISRGPSCRCSAR